MLITKSWYYKSLNHHSYQIRPFKQIRLFIYYDYHLNQKLVFIQRLFLENTNQWERGQDSTQKIASFIFLLDETFRPKFYLILSLKFFQQMCSRYMWLRNSKYLIEFYVIIYFRWSHNKRIFKTMTYDYILLQYGHEDIYIFPRSHTDMKKNVWPQRNGRRGRRGIFELAQNAYILGNIVTGFSKTRIWNKEDK